MTTLPTLTPACNAANLATAGLGYRAKRAKSAMVLNSGSRGYRLLTPGNPKTEKGRGLGYWTFIMHFAPAKLSGFNVCPMATEGCKRACLNTAGRGGIMQGGLLTYEQVKGGRRNQIQSARRLRTRAFFEHREAFMNELAREIAKAVREAKRDGYVPVFRLNGTSDIRWETIPVAGFPNIFALFSDVQFYDYTKIPNRRNIPANYHLTFSLADGNDSFARIAIANGMNVAAVFRSKETVARYMESGIDIGGTHVPVARGGDTDLRFLDEARHVIGLYAKGQAKSDRSGFVRD